MSRWAKPRAISATAPSSAPMVRAILSGAKTQTRRVMKVRCHSICEGDDGKLWPWSEDAELAEDFWHPCPFGKPRPSGRGGCQGGVT